MSSAACKRELVICPEGWRLYERWRVLVETPGSDADLIAVAWEDFQVHRKRCADCYEKEKEQRDERSEPHP